jgi:hypothetical protein
MIDLKYIFVEKEMQECIYSSEMNSGVRCEQHRSWFHR